MLTVVAMVVLGAGAAEDVELASSQLVRLVQRDDDVVALMGPRLLTERELAEAFRPDDTARELLEGAVARGAALPWVRTAALVVAALGMGAFVPLALGSSAVVPLLVAGSAALGVGLALAITSLVLQWQEARDRLRGVFAWNRSVWERRWGAGAPMLAEARAQWIGSCPDTESATLCLGATPIESDEQVLAAMDLRAPAAALAFRDAASRVTTGVIAYVVGLALMAGSLVPLLAVGTLPALAVSFVMLGVGVGTSLFGAFHMERAGKDAIEAIAAYDESVMHAALEAARAHDTRAAEPPPAEPPPTVAPPAEPQEAPSAPPPPPPTGPTRRPLRPQTSLDGPLPTVTLAAF